MVMTAAAATTAPAVNAPASRTASMRRPPPCVTKNALAPQLDVVSIIPVSKYYSRGFPVCGRAAAQRDVLAAWWCYIRSPPSGRRWLPGPGGDQPGVVVMPAGGGLVQPSPEGPAKREGKAGAGDQRGGVLPGEDGEPGGFGDGQLDGGDAGRGGLGAAAGEGGRGE